MPNVSDTQRAFFVSRDVVHHHQPDIPPSTRDVALHMEIGIYRSHSHVQRKVCILQVPGVKPPSRHSHCAGVLDGRSLVSRCTKN